MIICAPKWVCACVCVCVWAFVYDVSVSWTYVCLLVCMLLSIVGSMNVSVCACVCVLECMFMHNECECLHECGRTLSAWLSGSFRFWSKVTRIDLGLLPGFQSCAAGQNWKLEVPRGAAAQCPLASKDHSGLMLFQERTKLAPLHLASTESSALQEVGGGGIGGGGWGSLPKARTHLAVPKFGATVSICWGRSICSGGRQGVHGPGRQAISYHRALPPQPPATLELGGSFSSPLPSRGAAETACLPIVALRLTRCSAGGPRRPPACSLREPEAQNRARSSRVSLCLRPSAHSPCALRLVSRVTSSNRSLHPPYPGRHSSCLVLWAALRMSGSQRDHPEPDCALEWPGAGGNRSSCGEEAFGDSRHSPVSPHPVPSP